MNCKYFTLEIEGDKKETLENARHYTERIGIIFEGDDLSGSFNGQGVRGEYIVRGYNLDIKIYEKPTIMPCSFIKMHMKRAMRGENPPKPPKI